MSTVNQVNQISCQLTNAKLKFTLFLKQVEFLEKVEAQSTQRIIELEALEKSLREQLEARDADSNGNTNPAVLREKMAQLESQVAELQRQNAELEENEEICLCSSAT